MKTIKFVYVLMAVASCVSGCGHNMAYIETPSFEEPTTHNHQYALQNSYPATCTDEGFELYSCLCGDSYEQIIPAIGHDYGSWITSITSSCVTDGMQIRICKNDASHTQSRKIKAKGHVFGEWTDKEEATCIHVGIKTQVCVNCGKINTETIEPNITNHKNRTWNLIVEATYDKPGKESLVCLDCGKIITVDNIPRHSRNIQPQWYEMYMLELVNEERSRIGVPPLQFSSKYYECTIIRAEELSVSYSHKRPNVTKYVTLATEFGFDYTEVFTENGCVVDGTYDDEATMKKHVQTMIKLFVNSPAHYAALVSTEYDYIAIGIAESNGQLYCAQWFVTVP